MLCTLTAVLSFEFYLDALPNARHVYVHGQRWHAVGHLLPSAAVPQLPRNLFGKHGTEPVGGSEAEGGHLAEDLPHDMHRRRYGYGLIMFVGLLF